MSTTKLILFSLLSLILVSCNFSTTKTEWAQMSGTLPLVAKRSIDGVDYLLTDMLKYKNIATPDRKGFHIENEIVLYRIDQETDNMVCQLKFENEMDLKDIGKLSVDSVSFSINENKDKLDLKYFLNLGDQTKTVNLVLLKDGETWNIN